jgi:pimeloyl-ACP methyl ester carboxylesterase
MRPNDQTAWFPFAQDLADEGYAALTYNFRGYGESDVDQDFATLDDDLRGAIAFMQDRGHEQVFLVGASMGGTTSLVVAAQEEIGGIVAISAPGEFEGQDAIAAVPGIQEPKLLMAAEEDTPIMLSLEDMLEVAPEPVESEVYSGNLHGTALLGPESEHADAVRQRILMFLSDHAGA